MHKVATSWIIGQDPTFKILECASFGKYLAVSSDKILFIYSIRREPEIILDLQKEFKGISGSIKPLKNGILVLSSKTLYWMDEELELVDLWRNVYTFCIMSDSLFLCTKDKISLVDYDGENIVLKRETRSAVKYSRAWKIDSHTVLLEEKGGFYFMDVVTWELKQIYWAGRLNKLGFMSDKVAVAISRDYIVITKEENSLFFHKNGVKDKKTIVWSGKPLAIETFQVYLIATLGDCAEIRNINSGDLIQVLEITGANIIHLNDPIYICNSHTIWQFMVHSIHEQINELLDLNQYDSAKELLISSDVSDGLKLVKYKEIQLEHAKYTFKLKDAKKTLELLDEIKASPKTCIDIILGVSEQEIYSNFYT